MYAKARDNYIIKQTMTNHWFEILEYARFAPSPHNIQPWKIKIKDDRTADIYYLPDRLLPKTDPTGRFTILGFGIFFETIKIAANKYGYTLTVDYPNTQFDYTKREPTYFATLTLEPTNEKDILEAELIIKRRTSRIPYNGKLIDQQVQEELKGIARQYNNELTITTDPDLVNWLMFLNRDTLFYDMNDDNSRSEVGSWIRTSMQESLTTKDGLAAYALGFPGWLVKLFINHHEIMELPLVKQIIQSYYLSSMNGTTTIAWLKAPFKTPHDWMKNGHMLARLWLTMTKYNIYLHPFGSIITNPKAHHKLVEKIHAREGEKELWLIMRLGYSNEPPRSQRLDTEQIILK
jgi:hypothetical protein